MSLPAEQPASPNQTASSSVPPSLKRAVLEQALDEVLGLVDLEQRLDPVEMQALGQVVRRHPGLPFVPDPIGVELVEAVLSAFFQVAQESRGSWKQVATAVAKTLCEDPICRRRFEALWSRLSEV